VGGFSSSVTLISMLLVNNHANGLLVQVPAMSTRNAADEYKIGDKNQKAGTILRSQALSWTRAQVHPWFPQNTPGSIEVHLALVVGSNSSRISMSVGCQFLLQVAKASSRRPPTSSSSLSYSCHLTTHCYQRSLAPTSQTPWPDTVSRSQQPILECGCSPSRYM
jgi:hypothetical protein